LSEKDLEEFVELQKDRRDSENSWKVSVNDLDAETYDLSVKNPNKKDEGVLREPKEIIEEMRELDKKSAEILERVRGVV
ncbi:MAG: SAM-dependent DNA methyltransferase, partial [Patescibacteria group bacterium]